MNIYSAAQVAQRLPYEALIEALRVAFREDIKTPLRSLYPVHLASGSDATFGLMPAWRAGRVLATKLLTIFPDNVNLSLPTIHAQIVLFDGATGVPTAIVDGTEVTRRRTAATSALAASYLADERAEYLVIVGTGAQALHQALAHLSIRPIRRIGIWGRSPSKAHALIETLKQSCSLAHRPCPLQLHRVDDLKSAAHEADIISCATSASEPIIFGEWLKPGSFLDLVGSHMPTRRECDDEAMRRSRIYVDTIEGARAEAGDLLIPLRAGVIGEADILGDLPALCRGELAGRRTRDEITLFKSVGSAIEDLAASELVLTGTRVL